MPGQISSATLEHYLVEQHTLSRQIFDAGFRTIEKRVPGIVKTSTLSVDNSLHPLVASGKVFADCSLGIRDNFTSLSFSVDVRVAGRCKILRLISHSLMKNP